MQPVPERSCATHMDADAFSGLVAAYRPVVLRGLVRDWPVVAAGQRGAAALAEYLGGLDNGMAVELMVGPPEIDGRFFYAQDWQGFNFDRYSVPLRPLLAELQRVSTQPNPPALYAGSVVAGRALPGFAAANPLPLATPGAEPRVWIGNRTRVATHFDVSDNIACVAAGRRRFILFPPDQVANLYVGPLETTMAGQPSSLVDPSHPDYDRFPLYRHAEAAGLVAELEPGDAIFIPSLWWHSVEAEGPLNLLVNYWWGQKDQASGFAALVHALLAVRDVHPPEREAWHSLFRHYVFDAGATGAGAHLPEAVQGVLAAPSPSRQDLIVGFLMRALERARISPSG